MGATISDLDERTPLGELVAEYYENTRPDNFENLVIVIARRLIKAQAEIEALRKEVKTLKGNQDTLETLARLG